jgi:hypothetical protein
MALTDVELRTRVRELIASGDLPREPPVIHRAGEVFWGVSSQGLPCLICGEPVPTVAYSWTGGRVAHLHAMYDAVWKQERVG